MSDQSESIVRRYFEALNARNLDALDGLVDAEITYHGWEVDGIDQLKAKVAAVFDGFPDVNIEIEDLVAQDAKVAVRLVVAGHHNGEFEGMAATGRSLRTTELNFFHILDGRIREGWQVYNQLDVLTQLGVMDEPEEMTATATS